MQKGKRHNILFELVQQKRNHDKKVMVPLCAVCFFGFLLERFIS